MGNAVKLPADQSFVLRSIYEWRFVGREVASGKGTGRLQTFGRVPAYFIHGEFHRTRVDVHKALQILELKELIKPLGPRLHENGTWILPPGRVLRVEDRPADSNPRGGLIHTGSRSWLFVDDELVSKSADSRALDLTKEGLAIIENDPETPRLGESCTALRERAEQYVRNMGGNFPGLNKLARQLNCAVSSLSNAIDDSRYLTARKAEYMAKTKKPRETSINDVVLDNTQQTTEPEPLERLIKEQEADRQSDNRRPRRSRPHS